MKFFFWILAIASCSAYRVETIQTNCGFRSTHTCAKYHIEEFNQKMMNAQHYVSHSTWHTKYFAYTTIVYAK